MHNRSLLRVLPVGLLLALGALFMHLNTIAFGPPRGSNHPTDASFLPMFAHLALVLVAGLYLPPALAAWFQHVAEQLG